MFLNFVNRTYDEDRKYEEIYYTVYDLDLITY